MHFVYYLKSTKDDVHFYLLGKTVYTIGRKNSDINLINDDSISRVHARVTIKNNDVFVEDTRSKYGTFFESSIQLKAGLQKQLKCEQNIKFGVLDNVFTLKRLELDVAISSLELVDQTQLNRYLAMLNSKIATEWSDQTTHLVVNDSFKLTAKVLCAITLKQPIVTVQYFRDLITAVKQNKPVPLNYMDYLPTLHESLLSKNIRLEYSAERKTLFKDKIFVFLSEQKLHYMDALATITGGRAIAWKKGLVPRSELKGAKPEYLFVESVQDNESQCYDDFFAEIQFLNSVGRRSIPFQEIALAIMHCSSTEYCNSFVNKTLVISDSEPTTAEHILAYDTQHKCDAEQHTNTELATPVQIDQSHDSAPCSKRTLDQTSNTTLAPCAKRARQQDVPPSTSSYRSSALIPSKLQQAAFSFIDSNEPDENENTTVNNPFASKRKAAKYTELPVTEPPAKKRNVDLKSVITDNVGTSLSSTQSRNSKQLSSKLTESENFPSLSPLQNIHNWVSNIEKENGLPEEVIAIMDDEDGDLRSKFNESFRNCIVVDIIPLIVRRSISINHSDCADVSSILKNFKKFKKVHHSFVQTDIIETTTDIIVGNTASDEQVVDQIDDVNFDRIEPRSRVAPAKSRRKFQYVT